MKIPIVLFFFLHLPLPLYMLPLLSHPARSPFSFLLMSYWNARCIGAGVWVECALVACVYQTILK